MALVLRALAELTENASVAAAGLCSQVNTHVFPAIIWQDSRATDDAVAGPMTNFGILDQRLALCNLPLRRNQPRFRASRNSTVG
ncbi:MAG: hypothetical protein ACKOED_06750 [Aestuariivirga sp.]|uniref:hypothetical protein n=1 Tax=Aestuariivirga sp. TaxID=2650926 RepID=UPI0038D1193F